MRSTRLARWTRGALGAGLGVLALSAATASAQELSVAQPSEPRPVGVYAGVEPGEAEAPPAFERLVRQRQRARRPVTILTWPGFAPLGDGGSRFFVQTTDPIVPEVRTEEGRVVLVFPQARVHLRNSTRWLETRFFNTPVLRARLERRRRDLAFVMIMRAPAVPRVTTEAGPDGTFHYVYIDFPPGDYAPVIAPPPEGGLAPAGEPAPEGPPPAPARELDPSLRELDDERPPGLEAGG